MSEQFIFMSSKLNLEPQTPATPEATAPAAMPEVITAPEVITVPPVQPVNIITKLVRAIDRAMSAEPKRTGHARIMAMILDASGGQAKYVSPAALKQLREWQRLYDLNLKLLTGTDFQTSKTAWLSHAESLGKSIHDETHHELTGYTLEDFKKSHEAKLEAARVNLQKIYHEAFPLCSTVAERCIAAAAAYTQQHEEHDRERHEWFGVAYSGQSAIVRAFREAIQMAVVRSKFVELGHASPSTILPYLNF